MFAYENIDRISISGDTINILRVTFTLYSTVVILNFHRTISRLHFLFSVSIQCVVDRRNFQAANRASQGEVWPTMRIARIAQ